VTRRRCPPREDKKPRLEQQEDGVEAGCDWRRRHSTRKAYLGVGVGEHLGYLFTGIWSVLIGVGVIQETALSTWLGWPRVVIDAGLAVGSAESRTDSTEPCFDGRPERHHIGHRSNS
jgi:hypothetical protein